MIIDITGLPHHQRLALRRSFRRRRSRPDDVAGRQKKSEDAILVDPEVYPSTRAVPAHPRRTFRAGDRRTAAQPV